MDNDTLTAFDGARHMATGSSEAVSRLVRQAMNADDTRAILVFSDTSGRVVDIDRREPVAASRGPGRPKLGVTSREVTLLPRHWEWLAAQPGGASVTLRRLVDAARRGGEGEARAARDAAYHFIHAMAGDRPGFEEASRSLFAGDRARFEAFTAPWPRDIASHALKLGFPDTD